MRASTQTLRDHLALGSFTVADLVTIRLGGKTAGSGITARITNAPRDITWSAVAYTSCVFEVGRVRHSLELEVDSLDLDLGNPVLFPTEFPGKKLSVLSSGGFLDRAYVTFAKLFMQANGTGIGAVTLFTGDVDKPDPSATEVRLSVKSAASRLTAKRPLRKVEAACPWRVYDPRCGATPITTSHTVEASPSPTVSVFKGNPVTSVTRPGWVLFTSGPNKGIVRAVRSNAAGVLTLAIPLPFIPVAADGFDVYVGCDQTRTTCRTVFSNLDRFGGASDAPRKV